MSVNANLFWAKLGKAVWPERYHPVPCHLLDVAAVARAYLRDVAPDTLRRWLGERLGLSDGGLLAWLPFFAGAHDIAKVTPGFQARGTPQTARLRERLLLSGFGFPGGQPPPHGLLGTAVLAGSLTRAGPWPALPAEVARRAAVAVGGHHGTFPADWGGQVTQLGNAAWHDARAAVLANLATACGITPETPTPRPPGGDDQAAYVFLAGLTAVADWVGSNETDFPPAGDPAVASGEDSLDGYAGEAEAHAGRALARLGWRHRGPRSELVPFAELFRDVLKGRPPRALQVVAERVGSEARGPSLVLIEAPMGEGKTEAAWYLADCWGRRGGAGAYVALPTMATSNQMFDRVTQFLGPLQAAQELMLLHGKSSLNENFAKSDPTQGEIYDDDGKPAGVIAEGWFAANKKHGLLAPHGVGTIDQALLAVLQTKHFFVRLFGLAGKCVILDEVHAYDAYMNTLLCRLLGWLSALGCPVVLLSATLPRGKREELVRAYAGPTAALAEVAYPRITVASPGRPATVEHVAADGKRARTVALQWKADADLAESLKLALAGGGCAAVIRNTVGLAQQTYLKLKAAFADTVPRITVELFHARFPFGRRMEIETAVLKRYGKGGTPADRTKHVLVATQVIEQSLDLDFDLMATDVAPIDLVLQRSGRLHRHEPRERPAGVAAPVLWLIRPEAKGDLPDFGASERIYNRYILLRSLAALSKRREVAVPAEIDALINEVYDETSTGASDFANAKKSMKQKLAESKFKAQSVVIPRSVGTGIYRMNDRDFTEDDDPRTAASRRAATRDIRPTVTLVIAYMIDGKEHLDPAGCRPMRTSRPTIEDTKEILANSVSVSNYPCVKHFAARHEVPGWSKNGILRYYRLVQVDTAGCSLPGDYAIVVDEYLGVLLNQVQEECDDTAI